LALLKSKIQPGSYLPGQNSTLSLYSLSLHVQEHHTPPVLTGPYRFYHLLYFLPRSMSTSKTHSLHPEDGGSLVLWNNGILPHHYLMSQPITSQLKSRLLQSTAHAVQVRQQKFTQNFGVITC